MNNYKMYMVTGVNTVYFLWANLPEKEIKLHLRDGETMKECAPEKAYSIRYCNQPIYELYTGIDRRCGLPYVGEMTIDKRQFACSELLKRTVNKTCCPIGNTGRK